LRNERSVPKIDRRDFLKLPAITGIVGPSFWVVSIWEKTVSDTQ
jgi:hypothetical protein